MIKIQQRHSRDWQNVQNSIRHYLWNCTRHLWRSIGVFDIWLCNVQLLIFTGEITHVPHTRPRFSCKLRRKTSNLNDRKRIKACTGHFVNTNAIRGCTRDTGTLLQWGYSQLHNRLLPASSCQWCCNVATRPLWLTPARFNTQRVHVN